jgi:opacity protein-like surface antigen
MMTPRFTPTLLAAALAATFSAATQAADADTEARFKALEARLAALETVDQMLKSQQKTTDQKGAAVSEEVQTSAGATSWVANTSIGGYGELHYNNLNGKGGAPDKKEIDFNRFVLFFGHKFDERTRFFSEVELEHVVASNVDKGEVELEQAYLEFDLNENHRAKAGLFLIPVGILNETHEPPTFYGVERNPVERDIIPATWWAGGVGLSGNFGAGFGYDFAIHEGLATSQVDGYKPSEGRQETSEASAKDPAYTARLKWTGLPGLRLAAAFQHQKNITQGTDATAGSANLYEVDGVYSQGPFMLKTL